MFPFVGAPMFYHGRRRKRKWALVTSAEGAVASGDVVCMALLKEQSHANPNSSPDVDMEDARAVGSELLASTSASEFTNVDGVTSTTTSFLPKQRRFRSKSAPTRGWKNRNGRQLLALRYGADSRWKFCSLTVDASVDVVLTSATECLLERSANWNFDADRLNRVSEGHPVVALGQKLFQCYRLNEAFQLDWTSLLLCFRLIENGYLHNPFHNAVHAADVAQAIHCFLQEPSLATTLNSFEKMACILAAFGHDLYHPGVNQKFLESSEHYFCRLYNNVSVLENFHWRCLVSILKESSVFVHFSASQWRQLLKTLEVLILATDMQRQQEYLNQFKAFLLSHTYTDVMEDNRSRLQFMQPYMESGEHPNLTDRNERMFVMQILIKCADIANPCRPWPISKEWSFRASTEFFNQGDQERRLGLPVTSFCDRFSTSVPKIQSGFMEYVAQPLFADWDQYIQSSLSSYMLKNLRTNCQHWNRMLREQVQQQESTSVIAAASSSGAAGSDNCLQSVSLKIPRESSATSLEEMAELEMQRPDVLLQRRASSSAISLRSRSPKTSLHNERRRVSLPASASCSTLWTASSGRRIYEAMSSSDLSNEPVRLRLSRSEILEYDDNAELEEAQQQEEQEQQQRQQQQQQQRQQQQEEHRSNERQDGERQSDDRRSWTQSDTDGGLKPQCTGGNGCGTPVDEMSMSDEEILDDDEAERLQQLVRSCRGQPSGQESTPLSHQQRRYSEPLVIGLSGFSTAGCGGSNNGKSGRGGGKRKPAETLSGELMQNLALFGRCTTSRRGSLPMTQKELDFVQLLNVNKRSSSGPDFAHDSSTSLVNRAVDVS